MGEIIKKLEEVFGRCHIAIDNEVISEEMLMKVFTDYFHKTIAKDKHNVGFILHTGSVCFDAIAVVYSALLCLLSNKTSSKDIIKSLEHGEYVIYGKKAKERYVFDGIIDGKKISMGAGDKYVKLSQKNGCKYIPEQSWHYIEPYNGNSKRLDGRGIRKKDSLKDRFFIEVLGVEKNDIPGVIDTSAVFITSRDRADYLIRNIEVIWDDQKANLLDLVTASYFTEEDEFYYGGNASKNEAVLKFTSKVSAARSLLLKKRGNTHLGFMIFGQEAISRGMSELPELLNRKSLMYSYVCSGMEAENTQELLEGYDSAEVFVCSGDFLLENTLPPVVENHFTTDMYKQINTIINKEHSIEIIDKTPVSKNDYKRFRENLLSIKRSDIHLDAKDYFIIQAHSLMNLFITAIFPMDELETLIESNYIDIVSVAAKLQSMSNSSKELPSFLQEKCEECLSILENIYEELKLSTPKELWIKLYLLRHPKDNIAIIVPKAYYARLLQSFFSKTATKNVIIVTASRFDTTKMYDHIIVVGDIYGKKFNAFSCNASTDIITLLYPFETATFNYRLKKSKRKWNNIVAKSTISFDTVGDSYEIESDEEITMNNMQEEVDDFIQNADTIFDWHSIGVSTSSGGNIGISEVVAFATFEDGQKALFTKNYKAYVFDENTGIAKEVSVNDLSEGDSIVFTSNDGNTKDIVSSLLQKLIEEGRLSNDLADKYNKSRMWKDELISFMQYNNLSVREVAMKLHENGATVQNLTIRNWLDEDAHTVGPRKQDSIWLIGKTVGNKEMEEHPEVYFEACREIRSLRMRILDQMGQAIINKLNKIQLPKESLFAGIYDQIDDMALILRIERIVEVNQMVPANVTNRPISM